MGYPVHLLISHSPGRSRLLRARVTLQVWRARLRPVVESRLGNTQRRKRRLSPRRRRGRGLRQWGEMSLSLGLQCPPENRPCPILFQVLEMRRDGGITVGSLHSNLSLEMGPAQQKLTLVPEQGVASGLTGHPLSATPALSSDLSALCI